MEQPPLPLPDHLRVRLEELEAHTNHVEFRQIEGLCRSLVVRGVQRKDPTTEKVLDSLLMVASKVLVGAYLADWEDTPANREALHLYSSAVRQRLLVLGQLVSLIENKNDLRP